MCVCACASDGGSLIPHCTPLPTMTAGIRQRCGSTLDVVNPTTPNTKVSAALRCRHLRFTSFTHTSKVFGRTHTLSVQTHTHPSPHSLKLVATLCSSSHASPTPFTRSLDKLMCHTLTHSPPLLAFEFVATRTLSNGFTHPSLFRIDISSSWSDTHTPLVDSTPAQRFCSGPHRPSLL